MPFHRIGGAWEKNYVGCSPALRRSIRLRQPVVDEQHVQPVEHGQVYRPPGHRPHEEQRDAEDVGARQEEQPSHRLEEGVELEGLEQGQGHGDGEG
ncbi:MAG: hypothetical protein DRP01_01900 [Archaeoglobales archaeon]|nr:MAG: hypothetical protein DRP01_01900 [Archaeoglobales archaeon]